MLQIVRAWVEPWIGAFTVILHLCCEINQSFPHKSYSILKNGVEKKLSPWLIFLWTFLSKRLLHPTLCSLLKHIWLTGAPSAKRWVISFQQRGANGEEWRIKVLYLLSVMTSGLWELVRDGELERRCSVSTDSNPAHRCQCPFKALITPFPRA